MLLPGFLTAMSWCVPGRGPELMAPWWGRKGRLVQAKALMHQQAGSGQCWALRLGRGAWLCLGAGEQVRMMLRMRGFLGTPQEAVFSFCT